MTAPNAGSAAHVHRSQLIYKCDFGGPVWRWFYCSCGATVVVKA